MEDEDHQVPSSADAEVACAPPEISQLPSANVCTGYCKAHRDRYRQLLTDPRPLQARSRQVVRARLLRAYLCAQVPLQSLVSSCPCPYTVLLVLTMPCLTNRLRIFLIRF